MIKKIFGFLKKLLKYILLAIIAFRLIGGLKSCGKVSASAEELSEIAEYGGIDYSDYPSANLLPYPFSGVSSTNLINYTYNYDGSITINGTILDGSFMNFYIRKSGELFLDPGTYSVELFGTNGQRIYLVTGCTNCSLSYEQGLKRQFTLNERDTIGNFVIQVQSGTYENLTLKVQFSKSDVYYPYSVPVSIQYKNGQEQGYEDGIQVYDNFFKGKAELYGLDESYTGVKISNISVDSSPYGVIFDGFPSTVQSYYNYYIKFTFDNNVNMNTLGITTEKFYVNTKELPIINQDGIYISNPQLYISIPSWSSPVNDFGAVLLYSALERSSSNTFFIDYISSEQSINNAAETYFNSISIYCTDYSTLKTVSFYTNTGYKDGYEQGKADGLKQGNDNGYEQGKADGLKEGESVGYEKAVSEGVSGSGLLYGVFVLLKLFFKLLTDLLSLKIAGDFTIGLFIIGIPASFMIINQVIKLVKNLMSAGGGKSDE